MISMSPADWIFLLIVTLPLAGRFFVELAAFLTARKHTALAKICDMAGRQAASIARALASLPPGSDFKAAEAALLANAKAVIVAEMDRSMPIAKVTHTKVEEIVQGELDKLVVAPVAVLPAG
jgi:hypothetical protein